MDVLFLSVSAGGGHVKAAEAIKEVVDKRYPNSRTLIVDTFKYINPIVDKLIIGSYLNSLKTTPQIYGMLYNMSETGDNLNDFSKTVNKLLSYRIKTLINEFKPSIIVCTHFFPLQMISNLKRKNKVDIPTVAILTDFVTHPFWFHDYTDAYVVAHEYMKLQMVKRGIPEKIIHPIGIPVASGFLQKKDRKEILKELRLDEKLTFLIMGGSLGFGEIKDTFSSLINCKKDLQVIAITGKNVKLKRYLEKSCINTNKKVRILSYTNRVADLMEISDFIITKPGGMTITESLVKELPIFIISPLPGQEERNAHFLINIGAAARILENEDMENILSQVVDNPLRVRHMKEITKFLAKPNSSSDTVDLLEKLINP
ncbi:MAG: UDP-N-acetylglucosamine--LPS N-acetylglucosamine transferase [Clostridia bacterium]|nr:UDP-N-acetylglucosamine--LPS N-acetylglucosamine transferase [Clostridia bacterium]